MIDPENRLFCRLDGLAGPKQEQQRLLALRESGLLEAESIPVFEEATQTAALFLDIPICILGLMDQDRQWLKSAVGLSRLGLMNELAASRQLPRNEAFCSHVVDSHQVLAIGDTSTHPAFAGSFLSQRYRIRSYLGVPLVDAAGYCLGTLAVMDLVPRTFTDKQIQFLELTARWSMSEFERAQLVKAQSIHLLGPSRKASSISHDSNYGFSLDESEAVTVPSKEVSSAPVAAEPNSSSFANPIKIQLLAQLTQELRTPLTSVMGMASVLNREIYGPLTSKQKEYLDIIHQSGQYLLSLVNEILELGSLDDSSKALNLTSVDIEMLCQQAINTLEQAANRREQEIRLSIEPGYRIWLLDKNKVRQILYHLIFSVIQSSSAGSIVRVHVSRKQNRLNVAIWVSHPWLGDSLPYAELHSYPMNGNSMASAESSQDSNLFWSKAESSVMAISASSTKTLAALEGQPQLEQSQLEALRSNLGLLLSRQLAELHGGQISIQGSIESGYRYVVSLPQMTELSEAL